MNDDQPHPFLDAISYERALRYAFEDELLCEALATMVYRHKNDIGSFPVTMPSWVLIALIDAVHKKALAEERKKLLLFGIDIERQRMKRETKDRPRADPRISEAEPEASLPLMLSPIDGP